jgi:hypothetical protein
MAEYGKGDRLDQSFAGFTRNKCEGDDMEAIRRLFAPSSATARAIITFAHLSPEHDKAGDILDRLQSAHGAVMCALLPCDALQSVTGLGVRSCADLLFSHALVHAKDELDFQLRTCLAESTSSRPHLLKSLFRRRQ